MDHADKINILIFGTVAAFTIMMLVMTKLSLDLLEE